MRFNFEFAEKVSIVYSNLCKPVYEKYGIGRTGLDILLFLANNPQYSNARDIVEIRHLKANLVSIHVDKLVKEGYLERKPIANDRRKIQLVITHKASSCIKEGRAVQQKFENILLSNITEEDLVTVRKAFLQMEKNLDSIQEEH